MPAPRSPSQSAGLRQRHHRRSTPVRLSPGYRGGSGPLLAAGGSCPGPSARPSRRPGAPMARPPPLRASDGGAGLVGVKRSSLGATPPGDAHARARGSSATQKTATSAGCASVASGSVEKGSPGSFRGTRRLTDTSRTRGRFRSKYGTWRSAPRGRPKGVSSHGTEPVMKTLPLSPRNNEVPSPQLTVITKKSSGGGSKSNKRGTASKAQVVRPSAARAGGSAPGERRRTGSSPEAEPPHP
mmetsp:Transcript_76350/g.210788  ORF Transcript_76350/g.210788 Transcript_76350/m.210788 type:complete len:241 (-) Transcript_76350:1369-2091(-)